MARERWVFVVSLLTVCLIWLNTSPRVAAQTNNYESTIRAKWKLVDGFDDVQPSWQIPLSDRSFVLTTHRRTDYQPQSGRRCEHIVLRAAKGEEKILAKHAMEAARAIDEFRARLWVRGNRAGIQLMAQVHLPRSIQDDKPLSMLVLGDKYDRPGHWQQLELRDLHDKVMQKTRVLRWDLGSNVDPGEAYIGAIVLNLYCDGGQNEIWVDDLEVTGVIPVHNGGKANDIRQVAFESPASREGITNGQELRPAESRWNPSVVKSNGEPLSFFKKLGFNCVWLADVPTETTLFDARKHGLWLISPVPSEQTDLAPFDRVVAWCAGMNLSPSNATHAYSVAKNIKRRDAAQRPIMVSVNDRTLNWSQHFEVVVTTGETPGSSSSTWRELSLNSERGTVDWLTLRDRVHSAVAHGATSFVLSSDADLQSSQRRRQLAELVNIELATIQPWFRTASAEYAESALTEKGDTIHVMANRRTYLALVSRMKNQHLADDLLTVPVSRYDQAFLIEPSGLSPLSLRQVPGGAELAVGRTIISAKILFANEPSFVQNMALHLRRNGARANELLLAEARAELLDIDRFIEASDVGAERAWYRQRLHSCQDLLPIAPTGVTNLVTSSRIEQVLVELHGIHQEILERNQANYRFEHLSRSSAPASERL